jgi:hypothetical protein
MATKTKTKKVRTEKELQEEAAQDKERQLRDVRAKYISEPTIFYKVGDRVRRGNIDESIVIEIIDGGKIYELHEIHINNHYGKMVRTESDSYVAWHEVIPYVPYVRGQVKIFHIDDDLRIQYYNGSIESVLSRHYHFGIDYTPDYQRGNVWELCDKVSLIRSIFEDVEIGKLAFIQLPFKEDSPAYEILDGKQRVNALIEYYEGRFEYCGVKYRDLHPYDRNHFRNFPISIGEIKENVTNAQKYKYFLRLNTGGKLQDEKHIRKVEELYRNALKKGANDENGKAINEQ